jgi:hypothetical protein
VLTYNDFEFCRAASQARFKPFTPTDDQATSILFGFAPDPPLGTKLTLDSTKPAEVRGSRIPFPKQTISAYAAAGDAAVAKSGEQSESAALAHWEYWNGSAWRKLSVSDETQGFRHSGLIQFIPPSDFSKKLEFARERYWLRMRPGVDDFDPVIRHVYLNTTMALQGLTVLNDILGSSNGKVSQKFRTIQPMVLPGQKLEVREPTLPSLRERELIRADEGEGAIQGVKDVATKTEQYWVIWHEVPNFYGSAARDRHYVLDRVRGEITFGDGTFGMIPPALPGNIRMATYRSGGGAAGNQPAGAISKLSTAVPSVQKVINWLPASGGTDAEETAALLERASHEVRHRRRAVTFEDFEDLAVLASRDVARAKCVPLYDLSSASGPRHKLPGVVSVVVLPRLSEPEPTPDSALLDRIRTFLDQWRLPTLETVVVGPEYVRVNVTAEIAVSDLNDSSDVENAVRQELDEYLHPVTGGPDGCGWEFGRLPQKFDLNLRLERIRGVSHLRQIHVGLLTRRQGIEKTGHFLICSGECKIEMVLEEQRAVEFA